MSLNANYMMLFNFFRFSLFMSTYLHKQTNYIIYERKNNAQLYYYSCTISKIIPHVFRSLKSQGVPDYPCNPLTVQLGVKPAIVLLHLNINAPEQQHH